MRPCNQCRQPIENKLQLCAACEEYNRQHKLQPKPSVSMTPVDTSNLKPVPPDATINVLLWALGLCFGTLGLLVGILFGSVKAAFIGMAIGWAVAAVLVPLFR
jgi:hypothetical protein